MNVNSYKVGIKTLEQPNWVYNDLRFHTRSEAHHYAELLRIRWRDLASAEVHEAAEEPNARFPVPSDRYAVKRFVSNKQHAGFSLIELLITVGIIITLATITLASVLAGMARADEESAKQSLRMILEAENKHYKTNNTYTYQLPALVADGINPDLGTGKKAKYIFFLLPCSAAWDAGECFKARAVPDEEMLFAGKRLCIDSTGSTSCF